MLITLFLMQLIGHIEKRKLIESRESWKQLFHWKNQDKRRYICQKKLRKLWL